MNSGDKEHDLPLSELTAISSIDGRYAGRAKRLRNYFSEYAIIKYRLKAEIEWLLALSAHPAIAEVPAFREEDRAALVAIVSDFDESSARRVKDIEKTTNHDVKAVEYFIKEKMTEGSLKEHTGAISEFVHFACTSEDITNLAYAQALGRSRDSVMLPAMDGLIDKLRGLSHEHAALPMMSRTHGQPATPTTLGKEIANFT